MASLELYFTVHNSELCLKDICFPTQTVDHAIARIRGQLSLRSDLVLIAPGKYNKKAPRFLVPATELQEYNLCSGDELILRASERTIDFLPISKPIPYLEQEPLSNWFARHVSASSETKYWPVSDSTYLYISVTLCENGFIDQNPTIIAKPVSEPFYRYLECRETLFRGVIPMTSITAVHFAALELMIRFGTHFERRNFDFCAILGQHWASMLLTLSNVIVSEWVKLSRDRNIVADPAKQFVSEFESLKANLQLNPFPVLSNPFGGTTMREYQLVVQPSLALVLNAKPKKEEEERTDALTRAVRVFPYVALKHWRIESKTLFVREVARQTVSAHPTIGFTIENAQNRQELASALRESFDARLQTYLQRTPVARQWMSEQGPPDPISSLPAEIRILIFGRQTLKVLGVVRSVSRRWREMARSLPLHHSPSSRLSAAKLMGLTIAFPRLSVLELASCDKLPAVGLYHLSRLERLSSLGLPFNSTEAHIKIATSVPSLQRSLRSFSLHSSSAVGLFSDEATYSLTNLSNLHTLVIGKQGLSAVLDVAASLSNLTSLDVSGGFPPPNFSTPVSESGHLARAFAKLPFDGKLEHLNINGVLPNAEDWNALTQFTRLTLLKLRNKSYSAIAPLPSEDTLRLLTSLTDLELMQFPIDQCSRLHVLTQLTRLASPSNGFEASHLQPLRTLSRLRRLAVGFTAVTDDIYMELSHFRNLEAMTGNAVNVSDRGVSYLGRITALRELQIAPCSNLTSASIFTIADHLRLLRMLVMRNCDAIAAQSFASLGRLSSLTFLHISHSTLNSAALEQIAKSNLQLTNLNVAFSDVDSLSWTSQLTSLTHLSVAGNPRVDDASIASISTLCKLNFLDIAATNVTGVGLKDAHLLSSLRSLGLSAQPAVLPISVEGAKCIAALKKVHSLTVLFPVASEVLQALLSSTHWIRITLHGITEVELDLIAACKQLDYLSLHNTTLTDNFLKQKLTHLEHLNMIYVYTANLGIRRIALKPDAH